MEGVCNLLCLGFDIAPCLSMNSMAYSDIRVDYIILN